MEYNRIELYRVLDDELDVIMGPGQLIEFAEERIRYCDVPDIEDYESIMMNEKQLFKKIDDLRTNNVNNVLTHNEAVRILNLYLYDVSTEVFY